LAIQKKELVVRVVDYQLIANKLYKLGIDGITKSCKLDHECVGVIQDSHSGVTRGHYRGNPTMQKVLQVGLWWPVVFKDDKEYAKSHDIF
jgi:hypothetical protein